MKFKINYNDFITFYEEFASVFVAKEFPDGKLPAGKNIYSIGIWTHTEKIKNRALQIFGDGTINAAYFRKFIFRFKKTSTPGISRIALLRALFYWFEHIDNDFMQALPKLSTGKLTAYMWKEFCKRNNEEGY